MVYAVFTQLRERLTQYTFFHVTTAAERGRRESAPSPDPPPSAPGQSQSPPFQSKSKSSLNKVKGSKVEKPKPVSVRNSSSKKLKRNEVEDNINGTGQTSDEEGPREQISSSELEGTSENGFSGTTKSLAQRGRDALNKLLKKNPKEENLLSQAPKGRGRKANKRSISKDRFRPSREVSPDDVDDILKTIRNGRVQKCKSRPSKTKVSANFEPKNITSSKDIEITGKRKTPEEEPALGDNASSEKAKSNKRVKGPLNPNNHPNHEMTTPGDNLILQDESHPKFPLDLSKAQEFGFSAEYDQGRSNLDWKTYRKLDYKLNSNKATKYRTVFGSDSSDYSSGDEGVWTSTSEDLGHLAMCGNLKEHKPIRGIPYVYPGRRWNLGRELKKRHNIVPYPKEVQILHKEYAKERKQMRKDILECRVLKKSELELQRRYIKVDKDPLMPEDWLERDFPTIPTELFTNNEFKLVICSRDTENNRNYRACKALRELIKAGRDARDAKLLGRNDSILTAKHVKDYIKWAMVDGGLNLKDHLPLHALESCSDPDQTEAAIWRFLKRMKDLAEGWRQTYYNYNPIDYNERTGELLDNRKQYNLPEMPLIYGFFIAGPVVTILTLDANEPSAEPRPANIVTYSRVGQDIWNSLHIAITVCTMRDYLLTLGWEDKVPSVEEEEDEDD